MSSFWGPNFLFSCAHATLMCGDEPYPLECQVAVSNPWRWLKAVDGEARFYTVVMSYESTRHIINSQRHV